MSKYIIEVDKVKIRFNLASEKVDNLKEYVIRLAKHELMFQEFLALQDVSLQVKKGEAWGLIGANGSGKSTLLKTISGILKPDEGTVRVRGRIAPLIELGAGFDNNLTGRENIYLNGLVLGHSREFMQEHFDEIVEFANLKKFLDSPIKNFSSGMKARLGFSVATVTAPDVLIVDEVLEVGDMQFRRRCNERMQQMLANGTTLLYVSHNIDSVKNLCQKALWLDHGKVRMAGDAAEVCDAYKAEQEQIAREKKQASREKFRKSGKPYDYLIVGAGLYGAVFAREMTKNGRKCLVLERRSHVGGNLYTEEQDGILVHRFGPHIFHTSDPKIWKYVNRLAEFNSYVHAPLASYQNEVYNLPFNMNTFRQLWGLGRPQDVKERLERELSAEALKNQPRNDQEPAGLSGEEAREQTRDGQEPPAGISADEAQNQSPNGQDLPAVSAGIPQSLEEQALISVGREVYEKLIKGYLEKLWGRDCSGLPARLMAQIPVRLTYDNHYFDDSCQGIPVDGYTALIQKMLENVDVMTDTEFDAYRKAHPKKFRKILYTGGIDEYFGFRYGHLEYRTLRFETERLEEENFQGSAVVNYTDRGEPCLQIVEHKHFLPERERENPKPYTIITREYAAAQEPGCELCYPVRDEKNLALYEKYCQLAKKDKKAIFGGRLGSFQNYSMAQTIAAALACVQEELLVK